MRDRRTWFDLDDPAATNPRFAVVGCPFDGAVSLRSGAAEAPSRIRALSKTSDAVTRHGRRVLSPGIRDYGDVHVKDASGKPLSQREVFDGLSRAVNALPSSAIVIGLGGDNSVSIPLIEGFARRHGKDTGVIWFDAHPDLMAEYEGNPESHACALRRALTLTGIAPRHATLIATRSYSFEEVDFIEKEGVTLITASEWNTVGSVEVARRLSKQMEGLSAVYLAIDIDGFDASCAPGTGYPLPGGVSSEAFFSLFDLVIDRLPIRALDITEVAPPLDVGDVTSFLATQIILEVLGRAQK